MSHVTLKKVCNVIVSNSSFNKEYKHMLWLELHYWKGVDPIYKSVLTF